jgi:hypothetical protein
LQERFSSRLGPSVSRLILGNVGQPSFLPHHSSFLQNAGHATPKRPTQDEGHSTEVAIGDQIERSEANHQPEPREKTPIG